MWQSCCVEADAEPWAEAEPRGVQIQKQEPHTILWEKMWFDVMHGLQGQPTDGQKGIKARFLSLALSLSLYPYLCPF